MPATGASLTLTVPAGWQVVDLDGLLSDAVAEAMIEALGDELKAEEGEALRDAFRDLHEQVEADRIVFMALRADAQSGAREVMSLATPGQADPPSAALATQPGPAGSASSEAVGEAAARPAKAVPLGEGSAIAHCSPPAPDGTGGSWVQLVFFLPGTREGAILTLLSSDGGRGEGLQEEAEAVARSFGVAVDGPGER